MNNIKKYFSVSVPSILFLVLPYLTLHWNDIYNSPYFSVTGLGFFVIFFVVVQFCFYYLYTSSINLISVASIFILTIAFFIFYGINIVDVFFRWQMAHYSHQVIRNRFPFLINFSIVLIIELLVFNYKKSLFYFQNIFFIVFFFVSSVAAIVAFKKVKDINSFQSLSTINGNEKIESKPLIFIVLDEYHSPMGLLDAFNDSSILNFSKNLLAKGWAVNNRFHSNELSTIHSLSSLFNFNLSKDSSYSEMDINSMGTQKLLTSKLNDSLQKKHVAIINYGIFDIGNNQPITRLYFFPKNFLEELMRFSSIPLLFYNTDGFKLKGIAPSFYVEEMHNKKILNSLADTIKSYTQKQSFLYAHLYMPHSPMVFAPAFNYKQNTFENYFAYWKFTNTKVAVLLDSLISGNNYRIIVTGDHGFRKSKLLNPHDTFVAYWGFNQADIDEIKSVQDLGALINHYFN